jgi:hypothetical protein
MKLSALLLVFIATALAIIPPLAPPSVVHDIPVVYFGPPASSRVNPAMVGPTQLLSSTIDINQNQGTITLPLHKGTVAGGSSNSTIWYIVTDASLRDVAELIGVQYTPKLSLISTSLMRSISGTIGSDLSTLTFPAAFVDFTPVRNLVPGAEPNPWPLSNSSVPGSEAGMNYVPLVFHPERNLVLNAPIVASSDATEEMLNQFCQGITPDMFDAYNHVHDNVVAICPRDGTVTLRMTLALSFGRPFWYLAMDSSDRLHATLELATYTPGLTIVTTDCFQSTSCPSQIAMAVVNGYTATSANQSFSFPGSLLNFTESPFRQGLDSAALGEGTPLHAMGEIPTLGINTSPFWDLMEIQWTPEAIAQFIRVRVVDIFEIFGLNVEGWIENFPFGTELMSSGIVFNAPPVYRLY